MTFYASPPVRLHRNLHTRNSWASCWVPDTLALCTRDGGKRPPGIYTNASCIGENKTVLCGPTLTLQALTSYLLILQFALRHSLSAKAFSELLQLIAVHLPDGANLPRSVHNLKKFFSKLFPDLQATVHGYCSVCHKLLPSALSVREDCSTGQINRFITVSLELQLKRFFEGKL